MKSATVDMQTLLASASEMMWFDLFVMTLQDGTVLRYTTADADIVYGGHTYSSGPLLVQRQTVKWKTGLEVDKMTMKMYTDGTDVVDGSGVLQSVIAGKLDNAAVQVNRLYTQEFGDWSRGTIAIFSGNFGNITEIGRSHVLIDIVSKIQLLNRPVPSNVFQPSCRWTLFSVGCGLTKASFAVTGTVGTGGNKFAFNTSLTDADGEYDLGTIQFTSGLNMGVKRTVRLYHNTDGNVTLQYSLPFVPLMGDTFTIYPGCDKTFVRCDGRFSNSGNFGAEPNVPSPETAV